MCYSIDEYIHKKNYKAGENVIDGFPKLVNQLIERRLEDIIANIFDQVFYQSKLTYRVAFKDAFSLFIDTFLTPKK